MSSTVLQSVDNTRIKYAHLFPLIDLSCSKFRHGPETPVSKNFKEMGSYSNYWQVGCFTLTTCECL